MSAPRGPFRRRGWVGTGSPTTPAEPTARAGGDPIPTHPAPRPAGSSSVTWLLGVAVVLALAWITLNTLRTDEPGSRGVPVGEPLPPFAAPLALSDLEGDADIARKPNSGPEGKRPACELRGPKILNSCQLAERGPVALAFTATRSDRCQEQVDVLDRVRARYPDVQFAAVAVRGDRDDLRDTVRDRGWRLPVAHDRDGAVSNLYAVAVCPTITFAYRGGRVAETALAFQDEAALRRRLERVRRGPP